MTQDGLMSDALGEQFYRRNCNGETYQDIVTDYNQKHGTTRTRGFVASKIHRYRKTGNKIIHIPRSQVLRRPENDSTDTARWRVARDKVLAENRYTRVMHMNDMHLPYHDERAIELFLALADEFQPHIVVVGSDAFDFPTESRYDPDKDISVDDWLQQTGEYWIPVINTLRDILPDAILPFIFGNHDLRGLEAIGRSSIPVTAMREFRRIITHGDVLWLGKTGMVEIGNLSVAHGNKHNKHTAAGTAELFRFKPVNVGHTHRPQQFRSCVVNGMLCQKIPNYNDTGYPSQWQHGTTLITIDNMHGSVLQVPYLFEEAGDALWTVYAGEILTSRELKYNRIAA